jgi:LCP family protein required for cell wall assembly
MNGSFDDDNDVEIRKFDGQESGFGSARPEEGSRGSGNGVDGSYANSDGDGIGPADNTVDPNDPAQPKKKKLPLGAKIALIAVIVIIVIAAGAFIFVNCTVDRYIDKINYTHDPYDPFDTAPIPIDTLPPELDPWYDETDEPDPTATPEATGDVPGTEVPAGYTPTAVPTATPTPTPIPTSDVDDEADLLMSDKVYNILVIGTDTRDVDTFRGNSDVILLVSFNSATKKIWLTSFHRDSYVEIPGVGHRKINSAYAYGGARLLQRTLQEDFLVVAPNYCIINFDSFTKVIDAVGGVDITITKEEAEKGTVRGIKEPGTYTLNGKQALAYARERHLEGDDWGRTQRHRNVVSALIKKFKNQSVTQLLSTMDVLLPLVTTNIPKNEIRSLIYKAPEYAQYSVHELSLPRSGTWHNAYLKRTQETVVIDSFWRNVVAIRDNVYAGAL